MSVAFSSVVLVLVLVSTVVLTLVVENWGRLRVRLDRPAPDAVVEPPSRLATPRAADLAAEPEPEAVPGPGPEAVLEPAVLVDDRTVAVLFAAYAAARMPEDRRAAAWVTAAARPSQRHGLEFQPGAVLRGRPAAVQRLLECDDEDRCWVTLNQQVDIALGVGRRPPRCEVLAALVELWAGTRELPSRLDGELTPLRDAIDRLEPIWGPTPGALLVEPLALAVRDAVRCGRRSLLLGAGPTGVRGGAGEAPVNAIA